jgi:hypothetical protein
MRSRAKLSRFCEDTQSGIKSECSSRKSRFGLKQGIKLSDLRFTFSLNY